MKHRDNRVLRPRYGRIAALTSAITVTLIAALGGVGVFAQSSGSAPTAAANAAYTQQATGSLTETPTTGPSTGPTTGPSTGSSTGPSTGPTTGPTTSSSQPTTTTPSHEPTHSTPTAAADALPPASGQGRRVVFSQQRQRVWLVSADGDVQRTYLVSGSVTHNLVPGHYSVYSRSRHAIGIDDSGTMEYFVRFTQGPTGAAIGFHSIPTKDGNLVQTPAQLGTPQSHGCIRQRLADAIALWNFAPDETEVVVVA